MAQQRNWFGKNDLVHITTLWAASDLVDDSVEAAGYDAGFDGGEFSGLAHAGMLEKDIDRLAEEYCLDPKLVWDAMMEFEHWCEFCQVNTFAQPCKHFDFGPEVHKGYI